MSLKDELLTKNKTKNLSKDENFVEKTVKEDKPSEMVFWATIAQDGKFPTNLDGVQVAMKLDTAYKNIIAKPIENPFIPKETKDGVLLPGKSTHRDEESGKDVQDEQLIQTAIVMAKGPDVDNPKLQPGAIIQYYIRTARPVPFDFYGFEATSEGNILAIYTIATQEDVK